MSLFKEIADFGRQLGRGARYAYEAVRQGETTPDVPWDRPAPTPTPAVVANQPLTIMSSQPRSRESINYTQGRSEAQRAGALLGGGDAGLVLDPLGRRGTGGLGRTTLLGR